MTIKVDEQNLKDLLKEYPAVEGAIKKQVESWLEHFKKKPFSEGVYNVWLNDIKDSINFINTEKAVIKKRGKEEKEETKTLTKKDTKILFEGHGLKKYYKKILKILKEYIDLKKEYYPLIAVWILGTYLHKQFPAYPYLFFNAMKGSGKTRTLKIISQLSKNGKVAGSMTEAVLFRTAKDRTLCIDEFESMNAKGNENLKLLLNSAYKRGTTIERMSKRKTPDGEQQVVEEFEVYCPIVIANIWGMENVLGDRCISVILEKSNRNEIIKLIENFEYDNEFIEIREELKKITEKISPDSNIFGHIFFKWNSYQKNVVSNVSNVSKVNNVNNVSNNVVSSKSKKIKEINENPKISKGKPYDTYDIYDTYVIFQKLSKTNISGRELELFLPLFIISDIIGDEILDKMLILSKNVIKEKRETDREENKDVKLYEFLSQSSYGDYVKSSDVARDFAEFIGEDEKYNTSRSVSRRLNTLNLILDKKSTGKQRQIKLDILKAKEKIKMFKPETEEMTEEELMKKVVIDYKSEGAINK